LIAINESKWREELRKLEMRLLARASWRASSDDLVRYHGKFMIIDRKDLYLLAFNFTHLISIAVEAGLITRNRHCRRSGSALCGCQAAAICSEVSQLSCQPTECSGAIGSFH
jgi:hypothetical protein